MKRTSELNDYFLPSVEILLSTVSRILQQGICTRQDLTFMRLSLYEFQSNIEADYRFNTVIKHRVASLDLRYSEVEEITLSEKIFGFFSSEESRRAAKEQKAVKFILQEFQQQLFSLKLFAAHYDLSCSMDGHTKKYLTLAPI